jgi:hypothetical protein
VSSLNTVADNRVFTTGVCFRYGGSVSNFFLEFVREVKTVKTPLESVNKKFQPGTNQEIVQGSLAWDNLNPYSLGFGGDWRISRNVILNFGFRMIMDNDFKTTQVIPVANISCMMR